MIDRYARPRMKAVWSDKAKYDKWLAVELAVCEAWADEGVIPAGDMAKLRGASYDADRLDDILRETRHDMAAFLQATTEGLGDEGRWIHLGLTTSDVWDTATGLQLMDACDLLDEGIGTVLDRLRERALEHQSTLMMGRTHGIHAEPITFGLKMALWWDEMRRARKRLSQAREMVSVGKISGPVGGYATVSPAIEERVCRRLGIAPAPVSNQIVQRDRHAQYVGSLALIAASLEKFATEIRGLQRTEVREVSEPFPKGQAGSSSMPHKRNPELSERICGLSRLIRGHSTTALENVALWGERDISHSSAERVILPDSSMALDYMLGIFAEVVGGMHVDARRMRHNLESNGGVIFSQRVLLALVEKGLGRQDAYGKVHRLAIDSWESESDFREMVRSDPDISPHLSSTELEGLFDYHYYVRHVDEIFDRVGLA